MTRFLTRRLSQAIVVMLVVVIGNFVLVSLAPGDLVDVLGGTTDLTAEQMAQLRADYGLDQPWPVQLVKYIGRLAMFDLGYSPRNAAPVIDVILSRLPTTLILIVLAVSVSVIIGTLIGVIAARRAGRIEDMLISTSALVFYAAPAFITAIGLILVFAVWLRWLPIAGLTSVGRDLQGMAHVKDVAVHLIMPVLALSASYIAIYARICRATLLEILTLDYVRTARAKGLPERRIVYVHALRNALLPLVTLAGLQISALLGGAVLIETIFGLPGMGRTAYDAVFERDTNMLLGVLFISSLGVVLISFVVDLLYMVLDPRVKVS